MKYTAKLGLGLVALMMSGAIWAAGVWHEGVYYNKGQRVNYHGQMYEALQGHDAVKGANWNPEAAPSLWRKIEWQDNGSGMGGWREGVHYSKGQITTYRGQTYRCLQSHKAEKGAGWSPDRAPSLWENLNERPYPQPR
ncbi:hypothetical protein HQ393_14495 [Chitinibacter bivalviorum]|uniref:Chitin-binding type-3 domain-containing protein n=1 Tax=Chitinibacter bivalviorum TaxID=2739434 RepID=A0A7H9BLV4_9NEIS|nr:carbohydrate-binding protein [Chitinibacter bivalviorum]QLG89356.1 hypothetical protein HQ393_14495 [Chitinibacter bivalviorum]